MRQQQNLPCFCRRRTRPWRHRVDGTWQSSGACSTWEWRQCVCTAHKLPQDFVAGQSQRSWVHHSPSRKPRPTTVHSSDAPTCLRRNSEVWHNKRLIFLSHYHSRIILRSLSLLRFRGQHDAVTKIYYTIYFRDYKPLI